MRSSVARALASIALIGAMFVNVSSSFALGDPDANAYEILFSRVLDHPGDAALNKRFARDAEARGDLRHAFAALERVVLSSPGDTEAQAEFDRVRNKLKPAVTLTTVEVGANFVSNPRQLANTGTFLDEYNPLNHGAPFSLGHGEDATFDAKIYIADERLLGPIRWRSLALAKGQFQADDTRLNTQTISVESGPVFQLTPDVWLHVAAGGSMVWLNEEKLYDDASAGATIGGLYRGLTQSVTARYTWRDAHIALGQLEDDGEFADPKADSAHIFDLEGRFVVSPKLTTGDLFYFRPHLQVSQNDGDPTISFPMYGGPWDDLVLNRSLFPGDFTQLGAAVSYYYPLLAGRAFIGAGIEFYQRWYGESSSSLRTVGVCSNPPFCWNAYSVDVQAGNRRDAYFEPTAHLIVPNLLAPSVDLRFDYRYEHNSSNASMTTFDPSDGTIVNKPHDFENHVAGVHVVGRF
jgi:hypothetical protein